MITHGLLPNKHDHLCSHNLERVIHHKAGVEDGVCPRGGGEADSDAGLSGETLGEPGQGGERQHRV